LVNSDAGRQVDLALIDATTSAFQPDQVAPNKDENILNERALTPGRNVGHVAAMNYFTDKQ
jgi:hypothetical protein